MDSWCNINHEHLPGIGASDINLDLSLIRPKTQFWPLHHHQQQGPQTSTQVQAVAQTIDICVAFGASMGQGINLDKATLRLWTQT